MPAATLITAFVDFLISFIILIGMMVYYQFAPDWHILLLPFIIIQALLASLGPGLWITALNVKYRDFRYVIPFVVQFGLYVSPVGFSSKVVPEQWRMLYSLNPMVGVIDGFHSPRAPRLLPPIPPPPPCPHDPPIPRFCCA